MPPFAGFFSKDAVLDGACDAGARTAARSWPGSAWLVLVVGLVTVAVTAAYVTRAWLLIVLRRRRRSAAAAHEPPAAMRVAAARARRARRALGGLVVGRARVARLGPAAVRPRSPSPSSCSTGRPRC